MTLRWNWLGSASLVAVAFTSSAREASAQQEVTASLSWVRLPGSEQCIPTQALARSVEEILQKRVFVSPSIAGLTIEGRVEPLEQGGWLATVRTTEANGKDLGVRTLQTEPGQPCRSLDDNLALVLALTIDPDAVARWSAARAPAPPVPKQEPPPPPPTRVVVQKERVYVPVVAKPPPREEPVTGEARVAATLSAGVVPGAALGLLASGRLDLPSFLPIELTGYGWPDREAQASEGGATISMFAVSLAACPQMELAGSVWATACAGVAGGALRARGFGFDHVNEGTKPVVAVVPSLRLAWAFYGPLFASAGAGLHAAVVRPRYVVHEPDGTKRDVFQMAPVGGIGEIGIGMRFVP